jgi:hypothetical protein
MNVKDAIAAAKKYVNEVYADEHLSNLGLEEAEYDETSEQWVITLGFSRPWNVPRSAAQKLLAELGTDMPGRRSYKVVSVTKTGRVTSMKSRILAEIKE